jgi:integrase
MRNSFSVKTILRKDKCKIDDVNKHPLYYQIIFKNGKTKLPSGKHININQWDEKKRVVKDSLLKNILIKEESRIYNILLEMDNNDEDFTLENVKNKIKGNIEEKLNPDFYYHFDEFFKIKFGLGELSEGTKYHYELFRKQLKEYKSKINLEEINTKFIDDFIYYLKMEKKVGNSGIGTRIKCFSAVLNKFVIDKIITENPCKHVKRPKENSNCVFLNPDELKKVVNADLKMGNLTNGLELTRILFLFSCYSGLRYSDVVNLKKENIIDNKKIVIKMIKTKSNLEVFLNSSSKKILNNLNLKTKKDKDFVFKRRENVSVNRDLKMIGRLAKINKKLKFHVARHTFGSILALNNTPLQIIMNSMGHKDIRVTQIYMNSDEATTSKIMQSIKF